MNLKSVREWILKAESDLKIGTDEIGTENPATDAICFHMQQCVEKYLKAFLIFHGCEIGRTHVLEELIRRCMEIDPDFQQLFDMDAHLLTSYAVEARYPGDILFPPVEEAKEAIEIAKKAKRFILAKLEEKEFTP